MHPEGELRDHPEVAAPATTERPQEVRVAATVDLADAPVCRDDRHAEDVVRAHPEGTRGQTHPTAEGHAGDSHRRTRAGRDRDALTGQRGIDVDQLSAGADRRGAGAAVDADRVHLPQVDYDAV